MIVTERVTTITLSGVTEVQFNRGYPYYEVINMSDSTAYLSANESCVPNADGVYTVPAGQGKVVRLDSHVIYLGGSGTVQITAKYEAEPSFKGASKGGGGGTLPNAKAVQYALVNAGYNVNSDPKTWGQTIIDKYSEYDYMIDYSGTIFQYNDRTVTRNSTETAYCAYFNDDQGGWFYPIVIGATASSVEYSMYGYECPAQGTVEIDGKTIYYNVTALASYQGVKDSSPYNRRYLGDNIARTTVEECEKLAKQLYTEIKMIGYTI